jgi:transposase
MSRPYSQDLRDRVLGAVADGGSARGAAARFGLGVSTALVWVRRLKQTGDRSALAIGKPRGSKLDIHADFLLTLVSVTPDITLHEVQERLQADHGAHAAIGTLWRFYDRHDLTYKKNRARRRTDAA